MRVHRSGKPKTARVTSSTRIYVVAAPKVPDQALLPDLYLIGVQDANIGLRNQDGPFVIEDT